MIYVQKLLIVTTIVIYRPTGLIDRAMRNK